MVPSVQIVNTGIDTIKVNVKLLDEKGCPFKLQEVPDRLLALLQAWQDKAKENNKPLPTSMTFDDARMMMLPNGSPTWRYIIKNDCFQLAIAPRLKVPMIAKVTFYSAYLWKRATVNDAVDEVHSFLMDVFGPHLMLQSAQIDLCVDIVGFTPPDNWLEVFLTRARGKTVIEESQKDRSFYSGRNLETITFSGHGKPVSCKLYNKSREIELQGKKKTWFYDLWKQQQWDGESTVWRVEYSIEREGLHQMELEDIYDTLRNIKRLWAYCAQEWLRMAQPVADTNRSRWPTSPTWIVIQAAFDRYGDRILDALGPLVRERKRNADIDMLTAQIAGCSTTLAALCEELSEDDGAAEIFSVIYDKVQTRWNKLHVFPQDIVRDKKFLYSQKA